MSTIAANAENVANVPAAEPAPKHKGVTADVPAAAHDTTLADAAAADLKTGEAGAADGDSKAEDKEEMKEEAGEEVKEEGKEEVETADEVAPADADAADAADAAELSLPTSSSSLSSALSSELAFETVDPVGGVDSLPAALEGTLDIASYIVPKVELYEQSKVVEEYVIETFKNNPKDFLNNYATTLLQIAEEAWSTAESSKDAEIGAHQEVAG